MQWTPSARPFAGACLSIIVLSTMLGCSGNAPPSPSAVANSKPAKASPDPPNESADWTEVHRQVVTFCGDCHETPKADRFPRSAWSDEVDRGYNFYYDSGRVDLAIPPKNKIVAYFRDQAPETLPVANSLPPEDHLQFKRETIAIGPEESAGKPLLRAVSHLRWTKDQSGVSPRLLVCDMGVGDFAECKLSPENSTVLRRMEIGHPAHATPVDLDPQVVNEVLVADLGSFSPEDHDRGRVLWLREIDSKWESSVLAEGMGRVADIQPGDFDEDGDTDLIVAEFGWLKTGRILMLVNQGGKSPRFDLNVVDRRHGTIHVPTADINGDGHLDFVALVSQEHETIDAFLGNGDGTFQRQVIYAADAPSFGSSGIQLVDLDGDEDLDVLFTNGDMLDSFFFKSYHGVRWIENRGEAGWEHHLLSTMPGVMRAVAGDLDGDGDLDVVATAFVSEKAFNQNKSDVTLASLMWMEQVAPGEFKPHVLEVGQCHHAALDVGDFDDDGDLDLAVGNFHITDAASVTIWWNTSK